MTKTNGHLDFVQGILFGAHAIVSDNDNASSQCIFGFNFMKVSTIMNWVKFIRAALNLGTIKDIMSSGLHVLHCDCVID